MINFFIKTFGCKINQAESEKIVASLSKKGFVKTTESEADVAIINTCTVTKNADQKSVKEIQKHYNHKKRVFVTGCLTKLESDAIKKRFPDLVIFDKPADQLYDKMFERYFQNHFPGYRFDKTKTGDGKIINDLSSRRARYFIKIEDGCDQFCAYCRTILARGRPVSVDPEIIIKELNNALQQGFYEIVLSGINIGKYNRNKMDLAGLLKYIIDYFSENVFRIRISSIEPDTITDNLIELFESHKYKKYLCPQLHLPLQSGSDRILRKMNRPYSMADYLNVINRFKKTDSYFTFSTDIIVGFPGESREDFFETLNAVKNMKFLKTHIFPFSARPETPAVEMTPVVSPEMVHERLNELNEVSRVVRRDVISSFHNKRQEMICETSFAVDKTFISGTTEYYIKVYLEKKSLSNRGYNNNSTKDLYRKPIPVMIDIKKNFEGKNLDINHVCHICEIVD